MKFLTITIVALGCMLLASCFDIREEIWIERDGSGRAVLEYVVPSSAIALAGGEETLRADVQRLIDSEPSLRLDEFKVTTSAKDTTVTARLSTDSMLSLMDMQDNEVIQSMPDTTAGFAGTFDVRLEGLAVDFDRRINLKETLGLTALAISGSERRSRELRYIIHLPNKPEIHNAVRSDNDGRTLIWEYSLGEALSSPISTSFVVRIPIPWWIIAGAVLLLALLVWAISRAWRKRKARARKA